MAGRFPFPCFGEDAMSDKKALRAAIAADPRDGLARLAYADWLEERGDARAELVRIEEEMAPRSVLRPLPEPQAETERVAGRIAEGVAQEDAIRHGVPAAVRARRAGRREGALADRARVRRAVVQDSDTRRRRQGGCARPGEDTGRQAAAFRARVGRAAAGRFQGRVAERPVLEEAGRGGDPSRAAGADGKALTPLRRRGRRTGRAGRRDRPRPGGARPLPPRVSCGPRPRRRRNGRRQRPGAPSRRGSKRHPCRARTPGRRGRRGSPATRRRAVRAQAEGDRGSPTPR
ncbi:MAG: TIGR02996 domain-containing protein [Gemmataceae bacterium]|nr:TIGR02996 domain-containing protein [Gemmataceae bacterium]